jgi:hypothetical protein
MLLRLALSAACSVCSRHDSSPLVPGSSANRTRASISGSSDQLNGDDVRHGPLEVRKATLAHVLARPGNGIRLNDHIEEDGPTVFRHACKLGLERIVSKRKDSPYRSGRSPD